MVFFIILSVVIWFPMGSLGIFITLIYVIYTMRVGICDALNITIIPTLWTSILFCFFCCIKL